MTSVVTDRRFGVNGGLAIKAPVRVATTANIALSGLLTVDGVTTAADDRVLVKNQTTASENGIYDVSTGSWSRAADFNDNRDVAKGTLVYVNEGSTQSGTYFVVTSSNPITIGTSSISFSATASIGGFITTNTTLSVPSTYATVNAAMSYLSTKTIAPGITVTIQVADGTLVPTASCSLNHPQGAQINLIGNVSSPSSCIVQPASPPTFDLFYVTSGYTFGKIAGFRFNLSSKAASANNNTAILSEGAGSYVLVEDCQCNNWYYSYAARSGARMRTRRCTGSNAGDVSFWAFTGGMLWADNCTASDAIDVPNSLGFGFQGEFGGVVEATTCTATGCRVAGFAALSNGVGRYYSCTATGNTGGTGAGFMAKSGGKIEANGSTSGGAGALANTYSLWVSEDGGIYNGPTNAGNTNASNAFAYLSQAGGQAQVSSSTGPLRVDSTTATYFNTSNGLSAEVRDSGAALTSRLYLQGGDATTSDQAILGIDGTGSNLSIRYQAKGTGSHFFRASGGTQFEVFNTASSVNFLAATGAAAGAEPRLVATGSDADIDVRIQPKGTGLVRFGAKTGTGDVACDGYVSIKDDSGNTVKLMTTA
jgi:hypothetical protein